jgi:ketol-acid reductoisomerase
MTRIFLDEDVDLNLLRGRKLAVLGYGNQGRSQALNLRDGGYEVIVGNRDDACAAKAQADGFEVLPLDEAARRGDVLQMLLADEVQPEVYARDIGPTLAPGKSLVFSSGFNIFYGLIKPPAEVDVVLVAPEMIGLGVRENFLNQTGFPCLVGVWQDASGQALEMAAALAGAIGSTKMGALLSSFGEETLIDLMYEHSGILYHIRRVISVLIEAGVSPEAAIIGFYASGEEARLAQAYANIGLWHQLPLHSRTSQYGQEVTSRLPPEVESVELAHLRKIVSGIRDGSFARDWMQEQANGLENWRRIRRENVAHPVIRAERALYRRLGRLSASEDDDQRAMEIE